MKLRSYNVDDFVLCSEFAIAKISEPNHPNWAMVSGVQ